MIGSSMLSEHLTTAFASRLPLLVTGITGVAGFNALHCFQRLFPGKVIGMRPRATAELEGAGIVALDAEDRAEVEDLFRVHRFRAVLNCAGNCALKACELDPAMARLLNVVGAETMVATARKHTARLVHLSTDLVFSGARDGNYVETDLPDPVTVYGKTMAEAEALIGAEAPDAAVLRISLPMGPSFNRHAGAIDWIWSRFRAGRHATLYFDEVRSCTYTDDLSTVLLRFLLGDEHGIYHVGGPRPLSLYQIGQVVNRVGGFDPDLLKGCPRRAAGPMPPRAGNVSLKSDKLLGLLGHQAFRPWPAEPGLWPTGRHWHRERPRPGSFREMVERLYHASSDRIQSLVGRDDLRLAETFSHDSPTL